MRFFWQKEKIEERADQNMSVDDVLLSALTDKTVVDKTAALNIPTVNACVEYIANTISMLPIKLFQETGGKVEEIKNDPRIKLLNDDTKDTLTATQFWKAIIRDYFLDKGGYAYIRRNRNDITGIFYVDAVSISTRKNTDPIFKDYDILVNGASYYPFDFFKILRKTKDGCKSTNIIDENPYLLSVGYNTLKFEDNLVSLGGNKKGFIKAAKKLGQEAIDALKTAWKKLYANNNENVVILNDGLEFQESSNTSVEMQLNENKETNAIEFCKLFNVPISIIKGTATSQDYINGFKLACMPVIRDILSSLNRDFLLESEKDTKYWEFDTKELTKGDIKERYEAYKMAIESKWMQPDEVRYEENKEPLGLDFIMLGLDNVLYDPKTKQVFTPNTGQTQDMNNLKGSDTNGNGTTE